MSFVFYSFTAIWNTTEKQYAEGGAHVSILLDVSKSMNAVDAPDISRLVAAKQYIYSLISQNSGYEYALSIFAGESQRVLPLTQDVNLFATFLSGLSSSNIQVQGTNINAALADAAENFSPEQTGYIVLITDGDDEKIQVQADIKKQIQEKNLRVIIVGVWSEKWSYIPTANFASPYELYKGQPVIVRLNEKELQKLAQNIGWKYYNYSEKIEFDAWSHLNSQTKNTPWRTFLYLSLLFWILFVLSYGIVFYFPEKLHSYEK